MTRRRKKAEARAASSEVSWAAIGSQFGAGGTPSTRLAEGLSAVGAAVQATASALAATPPYVYRRNGQGREIDETHPLMRLIRNGPNEFQTWPDFIEWLVASILLRGNGLAEIGTDTRGAVTELKPVPWETATVSLLLNGRLAYDVSDIVSVFGGTGRRRRLLQDQVLHIRDRSDDGLIGRSRLSRAATVFNVALAGQEMAESVYRTGGFPSGALTLDGKLGGADGDRVREHLRNTIEGARQAGKIFVFEKGVSWQAFSVSPEDAELLASRRFTTEELARIFQVPPPIIGDLSHGTFTNSAEAGRWFVQHCLRPWCRKLEASIARACFTAEEMQTYSIEFDLSDLLRGDPEARWRSNQVAVDSGILTPNEVREQEGWSPRTDGEGLRTKPAAPAAPANQGGTAA
jgi:HK97 family phage portal protein